MEALTFWMTVLEGAAILLLTGSILYLVWTRRSGHGPGTGDEAFLPTEELKRLVEESQELSRELMKNLDEKKVMSNHLVQQMDEKIHKLTWLLNRAGDEQPPLPKEEKNPRRYLQAIQLAQGGRTPAEIGEQLHLTKGEVQLLLDLQAFCLK